jgi:hypothetical protein
MEYVKAVACRATRHERFNEIPVARPTNLYHAFTNKAKDVKAVGGIAKDGLLRNISLN